MKCRIAKLEGEYFVSSGQGIKIAILVEVLLLNQLFVFVVNILCFYHFQLFLLPISKL